MFSLALWLMFLLFYQLGVISLSTFMVLVAHRAGLNPVSGFVSSAWSSGCRRTQGGRVI